MLARWFDEATREELKELLTLAVGVVITLVFQIGLGITSTAFVGHYLGTTELAAAGLASSLINLFGVSVGYGLASALDTLCAQGFGSANKMLVGRSLQRGILILTVVCLPCAALWLHTERILLALSIEPAVARMVGRYMLDALPMLPFTFVYTLLERYLQAQDIVFPTMWINFAVFLANILFNYLFVGVFGLGLAGSAYTYIVDNAIGALSLIVYIKWTGTHLPTWPAWSAEALLEWRVFISLGLAGLAMICLEWWLYEIMQIVSGLLSTQAMDAQVVIYQLSVLFFILPYGIGEAAAVRVGNSLGAGDAVLARTAAYLSIGLAAIESMCMAALIFGLRSLLPLVITSDSNTVELAADVLRIVACFHIFDSFQGVCGGTLRGCGLQSKGVILNICGLYVLGLPLGMALGFRTALGLQGIWVGLGVGAFCQSLGYVWVMRRISWSEQARLAQERCKTEEVSTKAVEATASVQGTLESGTNMPDSELDSESAPLLSSLSGQGMSNMRLSQLPRDVLAWRAFWTFLAVTALIVSFILWAKLSDPVMCYPSPAVPSGDACISALAGHFCKVECDRGLPMGSLYCDSQGHWQGLVNCSGAHM